MRWLAALDNPIRAAARAAERGYATINPVRSIPPGRRPQQPGKRDVPWLEDDVVVTRLMDFLPDPFRLMFFVGQPVGAAPRRDLRPAAVGQLSSVPAVSAHSMRGLHATLATEAGVSGHAVAASLGQTSSSVTYESYATPGSVSAARQSSVLRVLSGGAE